MASLVHGGDINGGVDDLHPPLRDLPSAVARASEFLARANAARGRGYVNQEGGDVGGHSTERALVRHVANYLAAVEIAERAGVDDVVDVGSGTGGLAAWVAARLGARLHIVDRDAAVRDVAAAAFPDVSVHAELDEVAPHTVGLVMAMEVLEHIEADEQAGFVRALVERVEPGGLLVLSTPDETGYVGGWSGYAPHVAPVTWRRLRALLVAAGGPGADVRVWRLEGDPYHLGRVKRVLQPLANRAWTAVGPRVAPVARHLVGPATRMADLGRTTVGGGLVPEVTAVPPEQGAGTGLLGVVRLP